MEKQLSSARVVFQTVEGMCGLGEPNPKGTRKWPGRWVWWGMAEVNGIPVVGRHKEGMGTGCRTRCGRRKCVQGSVRVHVRLECSHSWWNVPSTTTVSQDPEREDPLRRKEQVVAAAAARQRQQRCACNNRQPRASNEYGPPSHNWRYSSTASVKESRVRRKE